MLTRVEIDGFKSFEDFHLDLGPFTVLMGANAAGKSNLFDALRFLSSTATKDLREAAHDDRGEAGGLLRRQPDGRVSDWLRLAVEVLLPANLIDAYSQPVELNQTRIRYELEVGLERHESGLQRLLVRREEATPIRRGDDAWAKRQAMDLPEALLRYRRQTPFLETLPNAGQLTFQIRQDVRQGRPRPAVAAEATVLSTINTAEFPHLYALREELRSWRFLQLDPAALRRPSSALAKDVLAIDGANLPTVLHRLRAETRTELRPQGALGSVALDLGGLIEGLRDVDVEELVESREFRVRIEMRDEAPIYAQSASDGTLRLLALLGLLHDPRRRGLVCFEEPENGLHPSRLKRLIRWLREMTAFEHAAESSFSLTQILMNSHSPVVLASLDDGEAVFLDTTTAVRRDPLPPSRRSRARKVIQGLAGTVGPDEDVVTRAEADAYLAHAQREGTAAE